MIARLVSLTCVLALGGLLAGCSADNSSSDSAALAPASAGDSAERVAADGAASGAADNSGSNGTSTDSKSPDKAGNASVSAAAATARMVRTAQITVAVKDVAKAADSVRTIAVTFGGLVSNETTGFSPPHEDADDEESTGVGGGDQESTITLRVPEPKMYDALSRIAAAGDERDRSTTSEDVTATIADLDSRVDSQTRSVVRVRKLLDDAQSLSDIVLLESELSQRESELEAIQARQRALADKAALATITVILRTPGAVLAEPAEAGFLAGFDQGWDALKASTTAVLTVIGALLPVAVLVALIGVPVYYVRRRVLSGSASTPPVAAAEPTPDPVVP